MAPVLSRGGSATVIYCIVLLLLVTASGTKVAVSSRDLRDASGGQRYAQCVANKAFCEGHPDASCEQYCAQWAALTDASWDAPYAHCMADKASCSSRPGYKTCEEYCTRWAWAWG